MKILVFIMSFFNTIFGAFAQTDNGIELLSPAEFKSCTDHKDVQLIDVRTAQEFNNGFINNAANLNIYQKRAFLEGLENFDKEKPIYVYCQVGGRSRNAAQILKKVGFKKIYDLKGGYQNYQ
jgi:phage shock protein E